MPYLLRDVVGRGASHSAEGDGGGRAQVSLPGSDAELDMEAGIEFCQV